MRFLSRQRWERTLELGFFVLLTPLILLAIIAHLLLRLFGGDE